MHVKYLGSMSKFNFSVNGVTKIFTGSIPKFNIQAQCTSTILHTLGGGLISWILAIHVHGKPPPDPQLFLTLLNAGVGRGGQSFSSIGES